MRLHNRLGAVTAGAAAAATFAALFVGGGAAYAEDDGPVEAGITVPKVTGMGEDWINGVDVSSILSLEESGVTFKDDAGEEADLFDVLADHGVNWVRVRVWNDPYAYSDIEDPSTRLGGYGAGNTDAERATEIAVRASEAGMKVLVNFHYSDFWAHPGQQISPKAWVGMDLATRVDALYDYTADTLADMEAAGADIGMVQIGNETTSGQIGGVSGWASTAQLFQAGSEAVRDTLGDDVKVAVHFTNPERAGQYASVAAELDARGVDYDVFLSSYYPYWHGSLENLTSVLNQVATTYDKEVAVAEVSWAHTLADGDGHENVIRTEYSQYSTSVQGQALAIRDVMQAVANVDGGKGIGTFYWEPAWLPVPGTADEREAKWEQFGAGWASSYSYEYIEDEFYGGSAWENQAMFDFEGNPLESLNVYEYAKVGTVGPREFDSVVSPAITVNDGDTITLPSTVAVRYTDGVTENQSVTWSASTSWVDGPGVYAFPGTTSEDIDVTATVTVRSATSTGENFVVNPGFESGASPWVGSGVGYTISSTSDPFAGSRSLHFWSGSDYSFGVQQTITGVPAGTYRLSAKVQGGDHGASDTIAITAASGISSVSANAKVQGYAVWQTPTTEPLTVSGDGTVVVSVALSLSAGAWGSIDDFTLIADDTVVPADTAELEALVADAEAVDRTGLSAVSLHFLDRDLRRAEFVLGSPNPSQESVDAAAAALAASIAGLEPGDGTLPDPIAVPVELAFVEGDEVELPDTVELLHFDESISTESVTWDGNQVYIDGTGVYTVHGSTASGYPATATITVTQRNWIINGSFEDADLSMWDLQGAGASIGSSSDAADGSTALAWWFDGGSYTFVLTQHLTGLPAGEYVLSATTQGGSSPDTDTRSVLLFAGSAGDDVQAEAAGWREFRTATTAPVAVGDDGTATVQANFTLSSGAWGTIDDFTLVKIAPVADFTELNELVSQASALNRSLYEPASLAGVEAAEAAYAVLSGADTPSQATVDTVADLFADGLAQLDLSDVAFTTAPVPTITGTAQFGKVLTANVGTWVPTPSGLAYQWKRDGNAITGATKSTYTAGIGDIGKKITVAVTASKADHITATKVSAPVTVKAAVFTAKPTPSIFGTPIKGRTLTALVGAWSPKPAAYAYQWYRDGKAIYGAQAKTYKVKASDVAHKLTVKVTATRAGFTTASKTSAATLVLRQFSEAPRPYLTGIPVRGYTLVAHVGNYTPKADKFSYQWLRNGKAISGATKYTYTLTRADRAAKITVKVTAKKSGYLSVAQVSRAKTISPF